MSYTIPKALIGFLSPVKGKKESTAVIASVTKDSAVLELSGGVSITVSVAEICGKVKLKKGDTLTFNQSSGALLSHEPLVKAKPSIAAKLKSSVTSRGTGCNIHRKQVI